MDEATFKARTRAFGLRSMKLCDSLPKSRSADVVGRQLLRSSLSVGANYRAACRAKSRKDMIAKLAIVEEECDESVNWLEVIAETEMISKRRLTGLIKEGNEILAMTVASIKTLRARSDAQSVQSKLQNPKSKIE
ncbi:MAG: four helix bundle protein [Planctomycetes bacterium]|nr:four helix bundle protein [Planctomycetota bacterium]